MDVDLIILDNNDIEHIERISWLRNELHLCLPNYDNVNIHKSIEYCEKRKQELNDLNRFESKKCKMIHYIKDCEFEFELSLVTDRDLLMELENCDHDHHQDFLNRFSNLLNLLKSYEYTCKLMRVEM